MGKSINIVSVTKDTIDSVVSEFTTNVNKYYNKTDKFVNVHFESPFSIGDVIRLDPDKIAEEKWLWCYSINKIASEFAFITDTKHAISLCFYISKLTLKIDENGICEALADLSYIDPITQESKCCSAWMHGANLKYFMSAEDYDSHPFEFDTIFPYAIGTEFFNDRTINHHEHSTFGWELNKIRYYQFNVTGFKHINGSFYIQNYWFDLGQYHFDWTQSIKEFRSNGWTSNVFAIRYKNRKNKVTGSLITQTIRNIYPVDEMNEHITPNMYYHYLLNTDASKHDIDVTGYLLRSLGFDSTGSKYKEFKKLAEGNIPEEEPKSKPKRNISKRKTKVETILAGLSDKQKEEMLKLLTQ